MEQSKKLSKWDWMWFGMVVLTIFAVFAQTRGFDYIFLDDNEYTYENPFVKGGLTWAGVVGAFRSVTWGGIWMPVTYVSYMLDISLFGAGAAGHHVASVAWHCVNAGLFYWLLVRIMGLYTAARQLGSSKGTGSAWSGRAFWAAVMTVLWAVHPMRAESVAWIASRKDLVFGFFVLLGSHAWLSRKWGCGAACMVLGAMGKPTAMAFPAVAVALELLTRRRRVDTEARVAWPSVAIRYGALLLIAIATGALASYSQTHVTGVDVQTGVIDVRGLYEGYGSFGWRCLNAAVALGMYLWHGATGQGIHILYLPKIDARPDDMWLGIGTLVVAIVAAAIAFWWFRGLRWTIAGCALWFLGTIGPTLGIAGGFGCQAYADRFTYWPMMAFGVLGCCVACEIWVFNMKVQRSRKSSSLGVLALKICCVIAAAGYYGWMGYLNVATYRANVTLWEHAAIVDPKHYVAIGELGAEYCRMGRVDEGIGLLRYCLSVHRTPDIAAHLADTLATRGMRQDFNEIKDLCSHVPEGEEVGAASRAKADDALGTVAMFEGRWDEAKARFEKALASSVAKQLGDDTPMRLAMCHFNTKDYEKAKPLLNKLATSQRPEVKAKAREMLQLIWRAERPQVFL